jgi:hypothetical protein
VNNIATNQNHTLTKTSNMQVRGKIDVYMPQLVDKCIKRWTFIHQIEM